MLEYLCWYSGLNHGMVFCVTCPCSVLLGSESSTVEIHISSEIRDYEDVDADGESLDNSVRH